MSRISDEAHADGGQAGGAGGGSSDGSTKTPEPKAGDEGKSGAKDGDGKSGDGKDGDGKPKISDTEANLLKENVKVKQRAQTAEAEAQRLKDELAKFQGVDPEKARAAVKAEQDAEEARLRAAGDFDRLKARMAEEHTTVTQTLQQQIDALKAENAGLKQTVEAQGIGRAFDNSEFIKQSLTLTPSKTRVIYGAHFDTKPDGSVVGYDKPRGAEGRTPFVDSLGNPLGFDAAIAKLIEADPEKDYLTRSQAKAGAGSGSDKPGSGKSITPPKAMSPEQKIATGLTALFATSK